MVAVSFRWRRLPKWLPLCVDKQKSEERGCSLSSDRSGAARRRRRAGDGVTAGPGRAVGEAAKD